MAGFFAILIYSFEYILWNSCLSLYQAIPTSIMGGVNTKK
ncbi:hypothetical protein AcetOrient_orf02908 [Acetobacter orientalis]|uniref:Uncharacterized protein n=1 Tax=Acetobacter orientalis TaxID=146474 RepID=A0A2Z5ZIS8_9PROT|nr:hypothetical protein AcetOrient_orf02908 [Acetobacter orientalis]